MKIAVYAPMKDEAANVKAWFASAQEADYVLACDTGSFDRSVEIAQDLGCLGTAIAVLPWRFDDAHNAVLAQVPWDADVCIPLHLDERLCPGWREVLEAKWVVGVTTKAFYTYQFDPAFTFLQNRIHSRSGYRWKYPDHEGVYPYGVTKEVTVTIPELRVEQTQDRSKDRSMILERLRWGLAENPGDSRMLHYLGRELMYRGEFPEAIQHFEAYLRLPPFFPEERAQTCTYLATCYRGLCR